jgi:adenine deaminase
LNAYVAAGIHTDHECTTLEEAQEKLRLGLTLFIREGTTTRNLRTLLPLVSPLNHTRMCFCTDDRQPSSLLDEGAIDHMVRVAIAEGIDPIMSIRMGSLNTANAFRLWDRGAVAVGRRADLIVFDDLHDLRAAAVFKNGVRVAETGRMIVPRAVSGYRNAQPSLSIDPAGLDFAMPAAGTQVHVIGADPNQVVTEHLVAHARIVDGMAVADPERDLLKIAVVERHHGSGRTGKGFISGVGLKRGALAGTVAHDHHNLVVIGADDTSMKTAARAVIALGGGLAAADGDQVLGTLALPVAGLMTDAPIDEVRAGYDELIAYARALGSTMHDPFMVMSFMGLEVIPKLKLTDFGLVDVEQFSLIDTFMDEGKHG